MCKYNMPTKTAGSLEIHKKLQLKDIIITTIIAGGGVYAVHGWYCFSSFTFSEVLWIKLRFPGFYGTQSCSNVLLVDVS